MVYFVTHYIVYVEYFLDIELNKRSVTLEKSDTIQIHEEVTLKNKQSKRYKFYQQTHTKKNPKNLFFIDFESRKFSEDIVEHLLNCTLKPGKSTNLSRN